MGVIGEICPLNIFCGGGGARTHASLGEAFFIWKKLNVKATELNVLSLQVEWKSLYLNSATEITHRSRGDLLGSNF